MSEEKLTPEQQVLINSYLNSWSSRIGKVIVGIIGSLAAVGGISGYAYISNITPFMVNSQISSLDKMKNNAYVNWIIKYK